MKIVFMGTPDFAVSSLKALLDTRHHICAVVTVPDKAQGRGLKVKASAVKNYALGNGLPVLQPISLKDPDFIGSLKSFNADCFVVVAFKILPVEIFSIPKYGTVNVHASLLPLYRGAAPINWAIINGDTETGVTTMFINKQVDTGNILKQKKVSISKDMTAGELHDILKDAGASLLVETIQLIEKNDLKPIIQDDALATKAPKINNEVTVIYFDRPAGDVHNRIRGLSPYPAAYAFLEGKKIKFFRSRVAEVRISGDPGSISLQGGDKLLVHCSPGSLEILELQMEGKKRMPARDFINGYRIREGSIFYSQKK